MNKPRQIKTRLRFDPVKLPPEYPLLVSKPFSQADQPIEYLHTHDCLELGFCFQGSGIFAIGSKVLPFRAGQAIFISPDEPHLAQSSPGTTSLWRWVWLHPDRLLDRQEPMTWTDLGVLSGPDFLNVQTGHSAESVRRIVEENDSRKSGWRDLVRAQLWSLLIELRRLRPPQVLPHKPGGDFARLAPALQVMTKDHSDELRMGDLARLCSLSEAQFRRIFRSTFGRSPLAYLTELRLRMAATLLTQTGRSVLEVSEKTGFPTLTSFNRAWRRTHKETPRDWRRRMLSVITS